MHKCEPNKTHLEASLSMARTISTTIQWSTIHRPKPMVNQNSTEHHVANSRAKWSKCSNGASCCITWCPCSLHAGKSDCRGFTFSETACVDVPHFTIFVEAATYTDHFFMWSPPPSLSQIYCSCSLSKEIITYHSKCSEWSSHIKQVNYSLVWMSVIKWDPQKQRELWNDE